LEMGIRNVCTFNSNNHLGNIIPKEGELNDYRDARRFKINMVTIKPFCKKKGKPINEKIVKDLPKRGIKLPAPAKKPKLKKVY